MPPRRTTRQSAASAADDESAPAAAPALAPARRVRASHTQAAAAPAEESADELDMDEPLKPVRRTRAPAKEKAPAVPKETKTSTGRKPAATRASAKAPAKETDPKPKAAGRRKVKEVVPIVESEAEVEDDLDTALNAKKDGEDAETGQEDADKGQSNAPPVDNVDDTAEEEEDEPTVRRVPPSASLAHGSQPRASSRRVSPAVPVPLQTEDDALDALLSQSQHRSVHQRAASQIEVPQTPLAVRVVPQTPAHPTARTRFVPDSIRGTAMKAGTAFPYTPGVFGRTPGPNPAQDAKPAVAAPKKRLVIHKLVLVDFKSYAGRQEIGPFHKVRLAAPPA